MDVKYRKCILWMSSICIEIMWLSCGRIIGNFYIDEKAWASHYVKPYIIGDMNRRLQNEKSSKVLFNSYIIYNDY